MFKHTNFYTKNKYGRSSTVIISKNSPPAPGITYTLPNLIMEGQKSYQQCRCHKEQSPMIISRRIWTGKKMKLASSDWPRPIVLSAKLYIIRSSYIVDKSIGIQYCCLVDR